MAAITPLNPYECLSRKIGYSVGLENLLRNTLELTRLYVRERAVTFATWSALVKDSFGRKERAAHEIANFFSALNLIRVMGRELHVLHGLDSLSVLRRYYDTDEEAFTAGARFLLTQAILEADGDIFLSTLAGKFEIEPSRTSLEAMVSWKWERLCRVFKNQEVQKKIWDVVGIKSQGRAPKTANAFATRKGPSPFEPRRQPFGESPSKDFRVADSYLEKILPTRKGWARDLSLFAESELTATGGKLLNRLPHIGIGNQAGTYFFWPYAPDLARLRIDPKALDAKELIDWDLLVTLAGVVADVDEETEASNRELVIGQLRRFHELYKAGSRDRGQIRHQLPLFMAKQLTIAAAVAGRTRIPPLMQIVTDEARSHHRRVTVTNLRGTDGALVFSQ